ncbi:MAG: cyclic nucleotide-binding domain-containing protein [Myxococcales bacterium]
MAKDVVDTRKLKDSAAELLKKGKLEKAVEVLEQLARHEPKDTSHRLRLGDAYRRIGDSAKAISWYQTAAKIFSEQDQLLKAIGAFKVILEIDPRNDEAQRELAHMNDRRFARPSLETAGLAAPQKPAAPAPPAAGIDLPPETGPVIAERMENRSAPQHPITERIRARNRGAQRGGGSTDRAVSSFSPDDLDVGLVGAAPAVSSTPSERSAVVAPPPPGSPPSPDLEASTPAAADDGFLTTPPVGVATGPVEKTTVPAKSPPGIAELLSPQGEDEIELVSVSTDETTDRIHRVRVEKPTPSGGQAAARKLPTKVPLFDDLSQAAFVSLVNQLSYRSFESGQQILREGEPGRSFFVIVEGRVRIWKQLDDGTDVFLAHLDEGAFFGEMALLSGAPRTANVSAEKDTVLLELSDVVLQKLARDHPGVVASLKNFYRQRLLSNVMAISPLFRGFDPGGQRQIIEKFRLRPSSRGDVLIAEGTISDGLYVVLHGSVSVSTKAKGAPVELAQLREGDIFGEMSLLTRKPAAASVTATSNALLLRLPRERFQELVVTHPQILELVSELTDKRAAATRAATEDQGIGSFV